MVWCFFHELLKIWSFDLSVWSPGIEFGSGAVYENSVCDGSEGYSARSKSPGRLSWRSETRVSGLVG